MKTKPLKQVVLKRGPLKGSRVIQLRDRLKHAVYKAGAAASRIG